MSYTGFTMKFPIIRVMDKDTGAVHIVGTDSHDMLAIDELTGELMYVNTQCARGTGGEFEEGDYIFVTNKKKYGYSEIEFVTFDELLETYKTQVELTAEQERNIRELLATCFRDLDSEIKKSHDAGFRHT